MSSPPLPSTEGSPALMDALRRVLRPLVRLLLKRQMTYPALSTLLKSIFLEVGCEDIPSGGKRLTDSRLSLMTGIHRKDIKRLLRESESPLSVPAPISLGARLIARWNADSAYLDQMGHPLPLPRLAQPDGRPSFERLVEEESKDIRSRAVLDEWLRLGVVRLEEATDQVVLCSGAFVPQSGQEEKLYYLGRNVRDHLETAVHNVLEEGPSRIERSAYADGLNEASLAELSQLAEEMGMHMLRALNARAQELKKAQHAAGETGEYRMSCGVFFFREGDQHHD